MRKYVSLKQFKKDPDKFTKADIVWMCSKQKLSESFMRAVKDKLIWNLICTYQNLSDKFMDEMQDYLDWWVVSSFQDLSEEFMDKFKDKLNWKEATYRQNYSEQFAWDHIDYIDINSLLRYNTEIFHPTELSEEFYRAAIFNYWEKGNQELFSIGFNTKQFGKDFVREIRHMFNFEVYDLYKKENKKDAEKFWIELKNQINEDVEWKWFVINTIPSLNFILRYKEQIGMCNVPVEEYQGKEREILIELRKREKFLNGKLA